MYKLHAFVLMVSFILAGQNLKASEINSFDVGSYKQVLQQYKGRPFVLVLWSLDCAPCRKELVMLGKVKKSMPEIPLLLVVTDGADNKQAVEKILSTSLLHDADNRVIDLGHDAQIRFEIDPTWYGEVPRSYLFNRKHQRQTIQGVLEHGRLTTWWHTVTNRN